MALFGFLIFFDRFGVTPANQLKIGVMKKGLCVGQDEVISIMINEEDHLRMQVMKSGFNLKEAWQIINDIDTELGNTLDFAYSMDFGYLTACPTNTGTGMRASVMLHLPSLVMTKQIGKVLQAITKLSLTARGLYGEGTEASGNFFQISNQVSLGHKEEDIIDNIERIIKQIVDHEQSARETLLSQNKEALEDRIWRAYGTLKSAHIITSTETIDLLSLVRLGVDLGVIKQTDRTLINELFVITQPAHLQKLEKKKLGAWLLVLAFSVALSRVIVGVHYPSDVFAGAVIGMIAAYSSNKFFSRKIKIALYLRSTRKLQIRILGGFKSSVSRLG